MLNLDRVRLRRVADHADAAEIAAGTAEIPADWYSLLTDTDDEAREWRSRNERRSLSREMASLAGR